MKKLDGRGLIVADPGPLMSRLRRGGVPRRPTLDDGPPCRLTTASRLNLWVVIGAVLVIFMQAGFALVETGFCRRNARRTRHVDELRDLRPGVRRVLPRRVPVHVRRVQLPGVSAWTPVGDALIGCGDWVFLWKGGWASPPGPRVAYWRAGRAFFLYMVAFMDTTATIPTGAMAERWKWKAFVGWGLFCGAIYYPLFGGWTWGGGWLTSSGTASSSASATSTSPAPASCTPWAARPRWPARSCSGLASASTARTASRARWRRTASPWPCSACSSCCSAGSGSTPHRRSPPPTCASRRRGEHRDRGRVRCDGRDVLRDAADREARPRHDGERHARWSRRHHGAVRFVQPGRRPSSVPSPRSS